MNTPTDALDELELSIIRNAEQGPPYFIQLSDRAAVGDSERKFPDSPVAFTIPPGLTDALDDAAAYGKLLGDAVFADAGISNAVVNAKGRAGIKGFRFRLDCDDAVIQALRWETILFQNQPLFTGGICLSRYLSPHKDTAKPLSRDSLRALIFISNPKSIEFTGAVDDPNFSADAPPEEQIHLAPIDVAKERAVAEKNLKGQSADGAITLTTDFLGSPGGGKLAELMRKLGEGYDILYIVCHGAWNNGNPVLYMEGDDGEVLDMDATKLADALGTMPAPPRLVVMASCQSAGSGEPTVASKKLSALGPLMARAGVPAVIAMQGFVTMATAEDFMGMLFAGLRQHGQVDRAVAAARAYAGGIGRKDYWMPVLYSSSRSGSIFAPKNQGFEPGKDKTPWQTITSRIKMGLCIPVLGPDCLAPIWGSTIELAEVLAKKYDFPLEEHLSQNLPSVAQYIKQVRDDSEYLIALDQHLSARCPDAPAGKDVWDRLSAVGQLRRTSGITDVHALLAALPCPIYFTACHDTLLEDALTERGRTPVVDFARWKEDVRNMAMYPKIDDEHTTPSPDHPVVYHLLGVCTKPDSMVVTDDDYTDYMFGINTQQCEDFTPTFIKSVVAEKALLLIGFHFKYRSFQVVVRNGLNRLREKNIKKTNMWVGAQMPPDPDTYLRVDDARDYLNQTIGTDLKIYWGGVQQFVNDFDMNARHDLPECFVPKAQTAQAQ
ncbi:MAG TPA: CHAT domain-containing protein [Candidatus Solibacter sp.]|nr:CHAT domain-containing protein [Candidatus Solibacter sp.]